MKKTHIGSTLDAFLQEDRLLEVATATATKRIIAHQIAMEMKRRRLTKMAMASRMKTSRAALDRLLDPNNPSVTIGTLEKAAAALNRRLAVGNAEGVEQGHFGLHGMRERAERLGGTLVIESTPGSGTTVRATVIRRDYDREIGEPAAAESTASL